MHAETKTFQMDKNNTYLASKPRYEILDGLRGVAALIVVAYHLFETYYPDPAEQVLNHGYLAVDFFFVLSGFVIGYAYDDRWNRMSIGNFFKRRLIRLHPMVIFGTVFGALLFYFASGAAFPIIGKTPWWLMILMMLWAFTMIPMPTSMDIRGWGETNPFNGPAWSLQWEYVANILYALFIRRFSKKVLAIFVGCSALLTISLCLNIDLIGLLKVREDNAYTVIGGWSLTPDQVQIGLTRLLYPFFAGLLISRIHKLISVPAGFWWCSLLIVIILVMPRIGGTTHAWLNGLYEAVCIILFFPFIVSLGAGSKITGRSAKFCNKLGQLSYPLYITHYPLIYFQVSWVENHQHAPLFMHIAVGVSLFILAISVAWAALKLYDLPLRAWLKTKLFSTVAKS